MGKREIFRGSNGSSLTDVDFCNQELSTVEEQQRFLTEMKAKVTQSSLELVESYSNMFKASEGFAAYKKQSIEDLRLYRHAVSIETKQIKAEIDSIAVLIKSIGLGSFKEFVELCERLDKLSGSGFFDKVKIGG